MQRMTFGLWAVIGVLTVAALQACAPTPAIHFAQYSKIIGDECDISIEYPVLSNLPDAVLQEKLNEKLKGLYLRPEYRHCEKPEGPAPIRFSYAVQGKVLLLDRNLISLLFDGYSFTGGAHGEPELFGFTFNPKTGRFHQFSDLFTGDWSSGIGGLIEKKLDTAEYVDKVFRKEMRAAVTVTRDQGFGVETGGVIVIFPVYELSPGAAGPLSVKLTWREITPWIDPKGPLASLAKP